MLSLNKLKKIEATPPVELADDHFDISQEDIMEDVEEVVAVAPKIDYHIPNKSWKQIFNDWDNPSLVGEWSAQISELEEFFTCSLPKEIMLNTWTKITNVAEFVHSHIETVKANNGRKTFAVYLQRLNELKTCLNLQYNQN